LRTPVLAANEFTTIGKETDRRWEQGEDSSMVDFKITEFRTTSKMAVAEPSETRKWKELGVRNIMRKSGLSQKAVYAILAGKPVRLQTLAHLKACIDPVSP
jgi:hypothetical protein